MSSDRDKPSRGGESAARPTARDVPFARGTDSDAESAPRGQRPAELPRDPTYEAELAQVDLAVLRDPHKPEDPSTRQLGRRGQPAVQPSPESVTPESPGTRAARRASVIASPEPPVSTGRVVASGTLLSVGAVDPRGKTEKNLETPRMFFSQADAGAEVYFRPGKIPAVTVNQSVESETVKLSDSVDPRRAKTIPRLDREQLAQLAGGDPESHGSESDHAVAVSPRSIPDLVLPDDSAHWHHDHRYAERPGALPSDHDGQIHASLSQFREDRAPSFSLDGAPTRPEPFAARRASEPPEASEVARPDASVVPTQRDLPGHRLQASTPPPAPATASHRSGRPASSSTSGDPPLSEGPTPTTASIAAVEPERRPMWHNYAAFFAALVVAVLLGMWWTRHQRTEQPATLRETPPSAPIRDDTPAVTPAPPPRSAPAFTAPGEPASEKAKPQSAPSPVRRAAPSEPRLSAGQATGTPAPRTSTSSKPARETIF